MNPNERLVIDILTNAPAHLSFVLKKLDAAGLPFSECSLTVVRLILDDRIELTDDRMLQLPAGGTP